MRHSKFLNSVTYAAVGMVLTAASCKHQIIDDASAYALSSGQATMLLGSDCGRPMELGYSSCQLRENEKVPMLTLGFMNAAEYAVSDCSFGIHKTGSIAQAGVVQIDLSGLTDQVQRYKFCLLRIEAIEKYPDPKDPKQVREIPFAGGFFIESLDKGYFPEPNDSVVSWCYKVSGTTKGRRKIEACK